MPIRTASRYRSPWSPWPAELVMCLWVVPAMICSAIAWAVAENPGFAPLFTLALLVITVKLLMDAAYVAGMRRIADSYRPHGDS